MSRLGAGLRAARDRVLDLAATVNRTPVMVLGKERSGTTAIAALLAEHTGSSVTLDVPPLWGRVALAIGAGERDLGEFVRRHARAFSRDIVKDPSLTFMYPRVREVFPEATYVMIVRDPRTNIRSVLNRIGAPGDAESVPRPSGADLDPAWALAFDGPALGLPGETYIEVAAARWNQAVDAYLDHRDEMTLVRYEDFTADKAGTIGALARDLGLPAVADITAGVDRPFQPGVATETAPAEFFGERNLQRIESICAERMRALGYATSH
jgi:hypothetical protein